MDEIIQIKCPFDGAVLKVKNIPGIESKKVTCPICKNKYAFTEFKRVDPHYGSDDDTQYPGMNEDTQYGSKGDPDTETLDKENTLIGSLRCDATRQFFNLKPGKNVIGRKAPHSKADFQIETGENRSMSREHIVVDVKKVPGKGYVHYVCLFKELVNKTYIEGEQLMWGDCLVLNSGDVIKLPGVDLQFEIRDPESTTF